MTATATRQEVFFLIERPGKGLYRAGATGDWNAAQQELNAGPAWRPMIVRRVNSAGQLERLIARKFKQQQMSDGVWFALSSDHLQFVVSLASKAADDYRRANPQAEPDPSTSDQRQEPPRRRPSQPRQEATTQTAEAKEEVKPPPGAGRHTEQARAAAHSAKAKADAYWKEPTPQQAEPTNKESAEPTQPPTQAPGHPAQANRWSSPFWRWVAPPLTLFSAAYFAASFPYWATHPNPATGNAASKTSPQEELLAKEVTPTGVVAKDVAPTGVEAKADTDDLRRLRDQGQAMADAAELRQRKAPSINRCPSSVWKRIPLNPGCLAVEAPAERVLAYQAHCEGVSPFLLERCFELRDELLSAPETRKEFLEHKEKERKRWEASCRDPLSAVVTVPACPTQAEAAR